MLASNIGIIKYNLVVTIFVLAFGAGASELGLVGLAAVCACAAVALLVVMLYFRPRRGGSL